MNQLNFRQSCKNQLCVSLFDGDSNLYYIEYNINHIEIRRIIDRRTESMQKKEQKKKSKGGVIFWVVAAIIFFFPTIMEAVQYADEEMLIGIVAAVCIVVFCLVFAAAKRKKSAGGSAPQKTTPRRSEQHTHDRIDTEHYSSTESPYQHYKTQLDGFLKAGIIEKSEYRVLLNRYIQDFGQN